MKYVAIINGPNLNLIGTREPAVYGSLSFDDFFKGLQNIFTDIHLKNWQSNLEGEIIESIQKHGLDSDCLGIVLNAGGYSHTSVAIADAVAGVQNPVVAVHISNIYAREPERRTDLIVSKCKGMVCGLGLEGYRYAIENLLIK